MTNIFPGSHGGSIQHSTFNVSTTYQTVATGFEILTKAVAPNAFHNSDNRTDPPKCHENTRVAVIAKIVDWVTGKIDTDSFMLWLYGPAGGGKSAIARTIAELCEAQGLLLASFFFFRSSNQRNTVKPLVASIAYCVTHKVPAARKPIEVIVEEDPLIFSYSLKTQLTKLVLKPLQSLLEQGQLSQTPLPPLIIIDGLDECQEKEAQTELIDLLSSSVAGYQLPLKFLIASRPEAQIKFAFEAVKAGNSQSGVTHLELNDYFQPEEDIRRFLEDKFRYIQQYHPLRSGLPPIWPSEEELQTLVRKASGQFIYASLAVRFANSPRHSPARRLDIVLELRPPVPHDLPFAELDALYTSILSCAQDEQLALKILGLHSALQAEYDSLEVIKAVLGDEGGVSDALIDLSSLLEIKSHPDEANPDELVFHHSSFLDYLFNKDRSKDYYIDIRNSHTMIAQWVLRHFTGKEHNCPSQGINPAHSVDLVPHLNLKDSFLELEHDLEGFSFGLYADGDYFDVFDLASRFFQNLKEIEGHKLYHHHSTLFLEHVCSSIDNRPSAQKFYFMSTVWFVLQKPLRSCVAKEGRLPTVRAASMWKQFCATRFGFLPEDIKWDGLYYNFLRYPTDYEHARQSLEPLARLYGGIIETTELFPALDLSQRLARVAIACMEHLRSRRSRRTRRANHILRRWAIRSKRSPWMHRCRTRPTSSHRGKATNDEQFPYALVWDWYLFPQSLHQVRRKLYSNVFQSARLYSTARRKYVWALDLLRRTICEAKESEDLIAALSKPFLPWPAHILFPRRIRRVRTAIDNYLEKFGPSPPEISNADSLEVARLEKEGLSEWVVLNSDR